MGAAVDCETIGTGILAQPVNALTSLALVLAGVVVISQVRALWVGFALIGTGIGSFLFHGPLAPGGEWIHDVTLAWLILVLGLHSRGWERRLGLPGLIVLGSVFLVAPGSGDPITLVLLGGTLIVLLLDDRSPTTLFPFTLLAAAAVIGRLGATGGPLCNANSVLQTHGLWHIGAGLAVAWWVVGRANQVDRPSLSEPRNTRLRGT
jgi:hypothetical protein